jgi:hypothetical protein
MSKIDYPKTCHTVFLVLPEKQREVIERRFGLKDGKKETLDSIGQDFQLTRERIRQIENEAFLRLREAANRLNNVSLYFNDYFKKSSGLRREDKALKDLGGDQFQTHVYFLFNIIDGFWRFKESDKFYTFWSIEPDPLDRVEIFLNDLEKKFQRARKLFSKEEIVKEEKEEPGLISSLLEIAKEIEEDRQGRFGLIEWPEIKPKGIKDKAYLIFKEKNEPLHFSQVARSIGKDNHPQTVHNELIRDPRFVLIGRGIYALKEWGYKEGTVGDIIRDILKKSKKGMTREEIVDKVEKQRMVKRNTILLNLSDKRFFSRDEADNYILKED